MSRKVKREVLALAIADLIKNILMFAGVFSVISVLTIIGFCGGVK